MIFVLFLVKKIKFSYKKDFKVEKKFTGRNAYLNKLVDIVRSLWREDDLKNFFVS